MLSEETENQLFFVLFVPFQCVSCEKFKIKLMLKNNNWFIE